MADLDLIDFELGEEQPIKENLFEAEDSQSSNQSTPSDEDSDSGFSREIIDTKAIIAADDEFGSSDSESIAREQPETKTFNLEQVPEITPEIPEANIATIEKVEPIKII